jgi:hypothetical protein
MDRITVLRAPSALTLKAALIGRVKRDFLPLLKRQPQDAQRVLRSIVCDRLVVDVEILGTLRKCRVSGTISLAPFATAALPLSFLRQR